jgi:hypothetical protein
VFSKFDRYVWESLLCEIRELYVKIEKGN